VRVDAWITALPGAAVTGAAVIAYGARHPRAQIFGSVISRTNSGRKLAITFDDGPNPAITPRLLELLAKYEARATFFLIGKYAKECPELVREIAAREHLAGNHTQSHVNLYATGPGRTRDELRRCQESIAGALASAGGKAPIWFRPPWGLRSPWLARPVRELGLRAVMWSVLPGDWRAPSDAWLIERMAGIAARAETLARAPQSEAEAAARLGGDILCIHDGSHAQQNADRTHTLAALEYWLPRWHDLGLEFVTIEEAVNTPA
jgi:peptidoglycan-N-acetylglucosamine deacetylase